MARKKQEHLIDRVYAFQADRRSFEYGLLTTQEQIAEAYKRAILVIDEMRARLQLCHAISDVNLTIHPDSEIVQPEVQS